MRITVFTPAYNRGYIIEKLYHSLRRQSFTDFEWVVVDDGSSDNTEQLFAKITQDVNFFPVRYVKTENGGKHRAINTGVSMAAGELFFIVDSDDYLSDDALEVIDQTERSIPADIKEQFAGVCGLRGYDADTPIGKTFAGEILDITMLERAKHKITGDKAEVIYTHVMKKYPFPTFEGENFLTEAVVWDRISRDGLKLRFFNRISIVCNYLPDGLSAQGSNIFVNNPKGWGLYLYQNGILGKTTGLDKWNAYYDYYLNLRGKLPFGKIAANLYINPVILWMRFTGMRVFYRLYR